ncbi:hypothetical protein, partial [Allomesorhizobium camelthorni]|uniref:hypothetical protein n=1 Tax=Allomesorhizobium camelthorni TaxID=475069 RepID=UPI001980F8F0
MSETAVGVSLYRGLAAIARRSVGSPLLSRSPSLGSLVLVVSRLKVCVWHTRVCPEVNCNG